MKRKFTRYLWNGYGQSTETITAADAGYYCNGSRQYISTEYRNGTGLNEFSIPLRAYLRQMIIEKSFSALQRWTVTS